MTAYDYQTLTAMAAVAAFDTSRRPALLSYVHRTGDVAGAVKAAARIAYQLPAAHSLDLVVDSAAPGYAVRSALRIVRVMVEDGPKNPSVDLVLAGLHTDPASIDVLTAMLDVIRSATRDGETAGAPAATS